MRKRDIERALQGSARDLNHLNHLNDLDILDSDLLDSLDTSERIQAGEKRARSHTRGRLTEEARERLAKELEEAPASEDDSEDERWSTWGAADAHGPEPRPDWVITEDSAIDTELGVLKTGKEADVFLLERAIPGTDRQSMLAAKRYRDSGHRQFHRDSGYLEGRRMKESREQRAVENRTKFGRNLIAQQWSVAEFEALSMLWTAGIAVPYPVQRIGTELIVEFIGSGGQAAPRLAEVRPDADRLEDLWHQLVDALTGMARMGFTHGDLSAYNLLVDGEELVLIDLPQLVDVVVNPQGPEFLARDVRNVSAWFAGHGLSPDIGDPDRLIRDLQAEAGLQ